MENTLLLGNSIAAKCKWVVWRRDGTSVGFGARYLNSNLILAN